MSVKKIIPALGLSSLLTACPPATNLPSTVKASLAPTPTPVVSAKADIAGRVEGALTGVKIKVDPVNGTVVGELTRQPIPTPTPTPTNNSGSSSSTWFPNPTPTPTVTGTPSSSPTATPSSSTSPSSSPTATPTPGTTSSPIVPSVTPSVIPCASTVDSEVSFSTVNSPYPSPDFPNTNISIDLSKNLVIQKNGQMYINVSFHISSSLIASGDKVYLYFSGGTTPPETASANGSVVVPRDILLNSSSTPVSFAVLIKKPTDISNKFPDGATVLSSTKKFTFTLTDTNVNCK